MLGRQPYTARRFFLKYQDRILFGTDGAPSIELYQEYYRFLETQDEDFGNPRRLQRMCGIALPDEVLAKVYHVNAERLIPGLDS
jgi:predicted TIM-barrel fold metal-dependent hydrolase